MGILPSVPSTVGAASGRHTNPRTDHDDAAPGDRNSPGGTPFGPHDYPATGPRPCRDFGFESTEFVRSGPRKRPNSSNGDERLARSPNSRPPSRPAPRSVS